MSHSEKPSQHTTSPARVLVTGASGFVASHLITQLLDRGYQVVATIRNSYHEAKVREIVGNANRQAINRLSFVTTDLTKDARWAEAMEGCSFVHHLASPFKKCLPEEEDSFIRSETEGTLRVLKFARDAGVKRAIITSSFAAIGWGHEGSPVFTERHWSVIDGKKSIPVFSKCKTMAEKAAWDFINTQGGGLELTAINPTTIFGPIMDGADQSDSMRLIHYMQKLAKSPSYPSLSFGVVDVRDVADLHIRAMESEVARNERFLATTDHGAISLIDIARLLQRKRPSTAPKVEESVVPDLAIRVVSWFRPSYRSAARELGVVRQMTNEKAKTALGWTPRSVEQCILDTSDSLAKYDAAGDDPGGQAGTWSGLEKF